jgi:hypothetical protein
MLTKKGKNNKTSIVEFGRRIGRAISHLLSNSRRLTQWEKSLTIEKSLLKTIYDAFGDNEAGGDDLVRISAAVSAAFDHLIRSLSGQGESLLVFRIG